MKSCRKRWRPDLPIKFPFLKQIAYRTFLVLNTCIYLDPFCWKRGRINCVSMIGTRSNHNKIPRYWRLRVLMIHHNIYPFRDWRLQTLECLQRSFVCSYGVRCVNMKIFTVISVPGHSCWTEIRDWRGWMVFIYRVMATVYCIGGVCGNWIHVFFFVRVQWDCLQIPRSVTTLDLGLEFGIRLDTILIHNCSRKKYAVGSLLIFLDLGLVGEKLKQVYCIQDLR